MKGHFICFINEMVLPSGHKICFYNEMVLMRGHSMFSLRNKKNYL